jgi:uncharacterized protein YjbI with pentapeptide repeats
MDTFLYNLLLSGADKWNQYRQEHPKVGMNPTGDIDPTRETDESVERFHSHEDYRRWADTIIHIDFDGFDFHDLVLRGYNLEGAQFLNSNCRNTRFAECKLSGDFAGAQLDNCVFQSCLLLLTSFEECDLRGVHFINCEGILLLDSQTLLRGAQIIGDRLTYYAFENVQKNANQTEFSMTKMTMKGGKLVSTDAEVVIGEVNKIDELPF